MFPEMSNFGSLPAEPEVYPLYQGGVRSAEQVPPVDCG